MRWRSKYAPTAPPHQVKEGVFTSSQSHFGHRLMDANANERARCFEARA
jgi:hypothetical protein